MTLRNSWPGPSGVTTTTDARIDLGGMIDDFVAGTPRVGVFPSNLNAIVTARTDMNVDIAAFAGVANQFGGPILLANDGTIQLPAVLVSPASGTNFYVIYVKQDESTSPGTDADNLTKAGSVLSTVSFAAARATLPTGAFELATVQVPTGVSATNAGGVTITQTFVYTVPEGGLLPVRNSTELAAWTPADGSPAWQLDVGQLWVRQGGAWILVGGAAPHFGYIKSSAFSWPTTLTATTFDASPTEGALTGFSTSDQKTFTCVIPGVYQVSTQVTAAATGTTNLNLELTKNGTAHRLANGASSTTGFTSLALIDVVRFAAGDTFQVLVQSGSNIGGVTGIQTYLTVDYLHF